MKKIRKKTEKVLEKVTHRWGTWSPAAQRTQTSVCRCGNKYIKTRKGQTVCLWCLNKSPHMVVGR